jgi:HEAT repeat protein
MSDEEFMARLMLGKSGGHDMKSVTTPHQLLEQAGGVEGMELLRDVLMREPEAGSGLLLTLRENIIQVIASIRDEPAVEPLVACFEVHRVWEDRIIELLEAAGADVPARYTVLADGIRPEDLASLDPEGYAGFRELLTHSYLEGHPNAMALVAVTSAKVRAAVATALGGVRVQSATEFLAGAIAGPERSDLVRWAAAAALAEHRDPRAVEPLGELLPWATGAKGQVFSGDVRRAVDALGGFEDERARAALVTLYERLPDDDENKELRRHVGERSGLVKPKRKGFFRR